MRSIVIWRGAGKHCLSVQTRPWYTFMWFLIIIKASLSSNLNNKHALYGQNTKPCLNIACKLASSIIFYFPIIIVHLDSDADHHGRHWQRSRRHDKETAPVSAYAPPGTLRPFCNDGVAEGKKYKYKSDQFHNLKCAKRCKYKCESNDWNKLTPIISTKRFLCLLFSGKDTQLPSHPPNDGCPTSWKSSGEKTQRTQFATSPLKLLLIIAESEAKSDNVKKKQNTKISCSHIIY